MPSSSRDLPVQSDCTVRQPGARSPGCGQSLGPDLVHWARPVAVCRTVDLQVTRDELSSETVRQRSPPCLYLAEIQFSFILTLLKKKNPSPTAGAVQRLQVCEGTHRSRARSGGHCCHLLAGCRQSLENAVHSAAVTMMQNASVINK